MDLQSSAQPETRRQFFAHLMRWMLGSLIVSVSAMLATRNSTGDGGQTCINQGVCGACRKLGHCGLPRAFSVRRARAERSDAEGAI